MARNEFKPPSDFVADDAGGSKRNVWKWLGIGCGVIALIIGGLLAAGAWKTVSCCTDAMDSARLSVKAAEFSTEFAGDLAAGNFEKAHAKMTDELQSKISTQQLERQIGEYQRFVEASPGRLSDVSAEQKPGDESIVWNMTVEFAPPAGQQKLVMLTKVISRGKEDEQRFLVDDLKFEARSRDKSAEPPAVEVQDFHRQLRGGSYEQAYRHMSTAFTNRSDLEAFRSFVREQKEVFRTGTIEVESVAYSGDGRAVVLAEAVGDGDERVKVEYELVRPSPGVQKWLIASVTPTYELADPATKDPATKGTATGKADGPDAGSEDALLEEKSPQDPRPQGAGEAETDQDE